MQARNTGQILIGKGRRGTAWILPVKINGRGPVVPDPDRVSHDTGWNDHGGNGDIGFKELLLNETGLAVGWFCLGQVVV